MTDHVTCSVVQAVNATGAARDRVKGVGRGGGCHLREGGCHPGGAEDSAQDMHAV